MTNHCPSNQPNFACPHCRLSLCADCLSIAAEYEWLAAARGLELLELEMRLHKLEADLALAQHLQATWKEVAQLGHAEVVQMFLDSTVWRRVCKPPKQERVREMRRLEATIRDTLGLNERSDRT